MLYFREFGDRKNPTILLLPGAGMAQTFYCQYGFADRFHLVEVHLLGTGEEAAKKWSLRENIDGVLAIIKEIGKEKVSLAGFSMGAQMAVALLCEKGSKADGDGSADDGGFSAAGQKQPEG